MRKWRQFRAIEKGEFIVVGYDLAMGGEDYCAVQFLSKTKLDIPLVYHAKVLATEATNDIYPVLEKIFDTTGVKPIIAPERQGGGLFEAERLATLNRLNKFELFKMPVSGRVDAPEAVRYGWDTNTSTRPKMLSDLKEAIDKQLIKIYDEETINELFSFIVVQTSSSWKAQAEVGAHDDLIFAAAIAWQLQQICNPITPKSEFRVYQGGDNVTGFGKTYKKHNEDVRFYKRR